MLNLDVVVSARKAKTGRAFKRGAGWVVQFEISDFRFSPIFSPLQNQNCVVRVAI